MSPQDRVERYAQVILEELSGESAHSQRSLARKAGIALGLANLCVRRFIQKGWVRAVHVQPNRVRYFLTPAGFAEKARRSTQAFQDSVRFYGEVKRRVRVNLDQVDSGGATRPRLVFAGLGEGAEIAYICLQGSPLRLVGVVDDQPRSDFFGVPVRPWSALSAERLGDDDYDRLVVTTFEDRAAVHARIAQAGVPPERIVWL